MRRGGVTDSLEVHQHHYTGAGSADMAVPARTPCFDDVLPITSEWACQALLVHVVAVLQWCVRRGGVTDSLKVHQHHCTGAGSAALAIPARTPYFDDVLPIASEWASQALLVHVEAVSQ